MAAFTSAAVTARTTSSCTITFNAAAIDCNVTQIKQLAKLFDRLIADMAGPEGSVSAAITVGALG